MEAHRNSILTRLYLSIPSVRALLSRCRSSTNCPPTHRRCRWSPFTTASYLAPPSYVAVCCCPSLLAASHHLPMPSATTPPRPSTATYHLSSSTTAQHHPPPTTGHFCSPLFIIIRRPPFAVLRRLPPPVLCRYLTPASVGHRRSPAADPACKTRRCAWHASGTLPSSSKASKLQLVRVCRGVRAGRAS